MPYAAKAATPPAPAPPTPPVSTSPPTLLEVDTDALLNGLLAGDLDTVAEVLLGIPEDDATAPVPTAPEPVIEDSLVAAFVAQRGVLGMVDPPAPEDSDFDEAAPDAL